MSLYVWAVFIGLHPYVNFPFSSLPPNTCLSEIGLLPGLLYGRTGEECINIFFPLILNYPDRFPVGGWGGGLGAGKDEKNF